MGSFTDWEWIRGALVWLGCTDPADTRSTILDNDPQKDELITVADLWWNAFGSTHQAVADIAKLADALVPEGKPVPMAIIELRNKLIEVACRGRWSAKSVGWWMRRHKDRIVSERSFRADERAARNGQLWWLDWATPPEPHAVLLTEREPGSDDIPF